MHRSIALSTEQQCCIAQTMRHREGTTGDSDGSDADKEDGDGDVAAFLGVCTDSLAREERVFAPTALLPLRQTPVQHTCLHARTHGSRTCSYARALAHTHIHTRTNMHTHARTPRTLARAHVWARVHRCCRHGEKNIAVTEYLSECSVPCTRCTGQAGGLVSGRSAKLPPGKIETTRVKDANHVARRWAQGNVSVLLPGTGVTAWGTNGCASERQEWRDARAPPCRACMPLEWLFDGWSQGQQNLSGADHRRASEPSLQIVSPTNAKLASD